MDQDELARLAKETRKRKGLFTGAWGQLKKRREGAKTAAAVAALVASGMSVAMASHAVSVAGSSRVDPAPAPTSAPAAPVDLGPLQDALRAVTAKCDRTARDAVRDRQAAKEATETVAREVADVTGRVQALPPPVPPVDLGPIQQGLADLRNSLGALAAAVAPVPELAVKVDQATEMVGNAEGRIDTLTKDVAGLTGRVDKIEQQVGSDHEDLLDLRARLELDPARTRR